MYYNPDAILRTKEELKELMRKLANTDPDIIGALEHTHHVSIINGEVVRYTSADLVRLSQHAVETEFQDFHFPDNMGVKTPTDSLVDEIRKIADMKAKGLLSEDEFQAAKRKVRGL